MLCSMLFRLSFDPPTQCVRASNTSVFGRFDWSVCDPCGSGSCGASVREVFGQASAGALGGALADTHLGGDRSPGASLSAQDGHFRSIYYDPRSPELPPAAFRQRKTGTD